MKKIIPLFAIAISFILLPLSSFAAASADTHFNIYNNSGKDFELLRLPSNNYGNLFCGKKEVEVWSTILVPSSPVPLHCFSTHHLSKTNNRFQLYLPGFYAQVKTANYHVYTAGPGRTHHLYETTGSVGRAYNGTLTRINSNTFKIVIGPDKVIK